MHRSEELIERRGCRRRRRTGECHGHSHRTDSLYSTSSSQNDSNEFGTALVHAISRPRTPRPFRPPSPLLLRRAGSSLAGLRVNESTDAATEIPQKLDSSSALKQYTTVQEAADRWSASARACQEKGEKHAFSRSESNRIESKLVWQCGFLSGHTFNAGMETVC
jgi:hypothetical protein